MSIEVGGLLGLIIFILDIFAIIKVLQSAADTGTKVVWVVAIVLLPVIGLVLWALLGPRSGAATEAYR